MLKHLFDRCGTNGVVTGALRGLVLQIAAAVGKDPKARLDRRLARQSTRPWHAGLAYPTAKSALIGMNRTSASEWGKFHININALCPGIFPAPLAADAIDDFRDQLLPKIPVGRCGGTEDLKRRALLLISEAGRHITCLCLVVDGGAIAL